MSGPARPVQRLGPHERLYAWFLTGPLGRVAAFIGDLGAYWLSWAKGRIGARSRR